MDEPLSSLDAKLRADLRVELKRIHANLGATMLYVTHDQIEAMTMADPCRRSRHGRLVQFGRHARSMNDPVSLYVAGRLGLPRINALPADFRRRAGGREDDGAAARAYPAGRRAIRRSSGSSIWAIRRACICVWTVTTSSP